MMKVRIAIMLLTVTILMGASGETSAQQASTKDILTWISSHFEGAEYSVANQHHDETYGLDFNGCSVTIKLTSVVTINPPQPSDGSGTFYWTYGPFSLDSLYPNASLAGQSTGAYRLWLHSSRNIPQSIGQGEGTFQSVSQVKVAFIDFSTKEMAQRQAKAWNDAIIACGGKAVPDNLY